MIPGTWKRKQVTVKRSPIPITHILYPNGSLAVSAHVIQVWGVECGIPKTGMFELNQCLLVKPCLGYYYSDLEIGMASILRGSHSRTYWHALFE